MTEESVTLPLRVGPVPAFLVVPEPSHDLPGALILHEGWGFNADVRRMTRLVADLGYVAVAPDLFAGYGLPRGLLDLSRGHGRTFDLAVDAVTWLRNHPATSDERLCIVGFSFGAALALRLGDLTGPDAIVANYGALPRANTLIGSCPVVASYGGRDPLLRGRGERLERILAEAGVVHDVKVYPDAGHSFLNDLSGPGEGPGLMRRLMNATHRPDAAIDAWQRTSNFLAAHV
jgi:carboxymethylenebutenolidase